MKKCICCGKELAMFPDNVNLLADAVQGTIIGAFGSGHDCAEFKIAICDECITVKVAHGIIEHLRNLSPWYVIRHGMALWSATHG